MTPMKRQHLAEFIGTFVLVFAGTGAITIDEITRGSIGHAGIALTFGLVVLAMIQTFGDISGAYVNPAMTSTRGRARHIQKAPLESRSCWSTSK